MFYPETPPLVAYTAAPAEAVKSKAVAKSAEQITEDLHASYPFHRPSNMSSRSSRRTRATAAEGDTQSAHNLAKLNRNERRA